jgi:molybdopterin/thiamine biosynthesis adenylyltransferase
VFDRTVFELGGRGPGTVAVFLCGTHTRQDVLELLHHSTTFARSWNVNPGALAGSELWPVVVWFSHAAEPPGGPTARLLSALRKADAGRLGTLLVLGNRADVSVRGWLKAGDQFLPVDELCLPGPGMLRMAVGRLWPLPESGDGAGFRGSQDRAGAQGAGAQAGGARDDRLSHVEAFVGRGNPAAGRELLRRAAEPRVAVIGIGRLGTLLVLQGLLPYGVGSGGGLVLIDDDTVEPANLDIGLLPPEVVGWPKVIAAARMAEVLSPGADVLPVAASVSERAAVEQIVASDFLLSCVDRDWARAAVAVLAARYLKPHIDLAGGGAYTQSGRFSAGGDVRLFLPGWGGCAGCGLDIGAALVELQRGSGDQRGQRAQNDWLRERPGVSPVVLHAVMSAAMHLFLRVLGGELRRPEWHRLDANGALLSWQDFNDQRSPECCVCGINGLQGKGDWEHSDA